MEPITTTALAVFLLPFLTKAGEKLTEKTVETLFDSHADLAEKFRGLFKPEFQTLGLSEISTTEEITKQLEAKPEVQEAIRQKVETNQDLLNDLVQSNNQITINAKNIGQIINNPNAPVNQTVTFT